MHKFLRAIGFTDFRKKDLEIITNEIIDLFSIGSVKDLAPISSNTRC